MECHEPTIQWFSKEYHDLNGTHIETLLKPPSAVEFLRLAHISRPVVIKGFKTPASTLWSNEYLSDKMGSRKISIAITPNGFADAVTLGPNKRLYFAEPLVEQMTMSEFLTSISSVCPVSNKEVHYLQSQNGNIYSSDHYSQGTDDAPEFEPLRCDVPSDISWCTEAFGKCHIPNFHRDSDDFVAIGRSPDAVNLWIGDSRSVTSIHSDPYENIYTVVRGTKHFTLLPPTEGWCLKERMYPHATYTRKSSGSHLTLEPSPASNSVRWSSVSDPQQPGNLPAEAHPIKVTLGVGDTLYLPAGWWHHVRQSKDITIALNWWYDMEMRGTSWVLLSFLRGASVVPDGNADAQAEENVDL